jgi:hypothetical protein
MVMICRLLLEPRAFSQPVFCVRAFCLFLGLAGSSLTSASCFCSKRTTTKYITYIWALHLRTPEIPEGTRYQFWRVYCRWAFDRLKHFCIAQNCIVLLIAVHTYIAHITEVMLMVVLHRSTSCSSYP